MKILGLGVPELVVILLVVLLIFGPKNLPKLGSAIGKTFKNLREGMDGKKKDEKKAVDISLPPQRLPRRLSSPRQSRRSRLPLPRRRRQRRRARYRGVLATLEHGRRVRETRARRLL